MEYTTEENQELIDNIKGPRYYRIILQGYGGESSYMGLTKEQYEFWNALTEDEGDSEVLQRSKNQLAKSSESLQKSKDRPTGSHYVSSSQNTMREL